MGKTKGARSHSTGLPYGGDEKVDRNGISTENHMEMWHRLVKNGPRMHGTPSERVKKTH